MMRTDVSSSRAMAVPFTLVLVTDGDDMEAILHRLLLIVCLLTPVTAHAVELTVGPRSEITHPGKGHEVQLSGSAVAVDREGGVLVAWIRHEGQTNHLYVGRPGMEASKAVRVNTEGLTV